MNVLDSLKEDKWIMLSVDKIKLSYLFVSSDSTVIMPEFATLGIYNVITT